MEILYYFANKNEIMFQWQKFHIINELKEHEIYFDIISPYNYESVEKANEAINNQIKNKRYDLFMTSFNEKILSIETLKNIKECGIATLLFCPDNLVVPYKHKNIAKYFDLVWLTAKETEYMFKKWGAKTIFLPYAANPNFCTYSLPKEEVERVGFIGTPHGSRISRINFLIENKIPVTVHTKKEATSNIGLKANYYNYIKVLYDDLKYPIGRKLAMGAIIDKLKKNKINLNNDFLELKLPVSLKKLPEINASYALVMSFTNANSTGYLKTPVKIINLRNFELPMCGALQICEYSDELAEYFEPNKEIIMCKTDEEYIDKVKYYLSSKREYERIKMKQAARIRAETEHTWYNRFSKIFLELGLILNKKYL